MLPCSPGAEIPVEAIIQEINSKENSLGNPDTDGKVLSSLQDGTRSWITVSTVVNWGDIQGTLSNQTDLQNALDLKLNTDGDGSSLTGLTKSQVGLGNVDNTSDIDKPVSSAQQTAIDSKVQTGTSGSVNNCVKIETMTQAEYDGITPETGTMYIIIG